MTTTTTLARNSNTLSRDAQADGWMAYINGGDYTGEQQGKLVDALMTAQRAEFERRLPDGCHWFPTLSEIHGPVGTDLPEDLDDLMGEACQAVIARYDAIEDAAEQAGRNR